MDKKASEEILEKLIGETEQVRKAKLFGRATAILIIRLFELVVKSSYWIIIIYIAISLSK